jgi:hypothetical protein
VSTGGSARELPGAVLYSERIAPPLWWALPVAGMAASVALALAVSLGPGAAAVGALVTFGLAAAAAVVLSRARLEVRADAVAIDRVVLPLSVLRAARALPAAEAARLRGADYDPRGWYRIRGWVSTAVLLTLSDPLDPTPFWYVSSRTPELAVAAVARAVGAAPVAEPAPDQPPDQPPDPPGAGTAAG